MKILKRLTEISGVVGDFTDGSGYTVRAMVSPMAGPTEKEVVLKMLKRLTEISGRGDDFPDGSGYGFSLDYGLGDSYGAGFENS